jgi:hypothetical protein
MRFMRPTINSLTLAVKREKAKVLELKRLLAASRQDSNFKESATIEQALLKQRRPSRISE